MTRGGGEVGTLAFVGRKEVSRFLVSHFISLITTIQVFVCGKADLIFISSFRLTCTHCRHLPLQFK